MFTPFFVCVGMLEFLSILICCIIVLVYQVDEMVLPCSAILGYEKNSWIGCIGADNMICLDWFMKIEKILVN